MEIFIRSWVAPAFRGSLAGISPDSVACELVRALAHQLQLQSVRRDAEHNPRDAGATPSVVSVIAHGLSTIFPASVPFLPIVFSSCNRCASTVCDSGNTRPIF